MLHEVQDLTWLRTCLALCVRRQTSVVKTWARAGLACHHHASTTILLLALVAAYAGVELRMSESPASKIAIVEHLNSLPQAVPSSICITWQSQLSTLQSLRTESFFSGLQKCYPPKPASKLFRRVGVCILQNDVRRTLLPEKWCTAVFANML